MVILERFLLFPRSGRLLIEYTKSNQEMLEDG